MPRILLVDDEPENLKALRRAMLDENQGWEILTAVGEREAMECLETCKREARAVDVVLTDLVMETESSGMNVILNARKIDPNVMAILFTAKERSLDRYAALDYGAFDVVEKNIRGTQAVREILIKTSTAIRYREYTRHVAFLQRYFDPRLFETINRDASLLSVRNATVTIVFWDIRGFSRLCETLKAHPALISGFLRDYSEAGAQAVFDNSGVLDKFIGDGIMALFGVIGDCQDARDSQPVLDAVNAAKSLRMSFGRVYDKWQDEWRLYAADKIDIGLGCGIHTGEVLVGNMGTELRDQFTAIGPDVNLCSRIEGRAASGQILLSQTARARIKDSVSLKSVGAIDNIKNIPGTFLLYEVDS